ncbi:hypothetical protein AXW84_06460 [Hymenobacter sp. PAMC 26628]|nr:hypothetical protein AXW84_06460 [Hymenobacter sp. PAMC 26628]
MLKIKGLWNLANERRVTALMIAIVEISGHAVLRVRQAAEHGPLARHISAGLNDPQPVPPHGCPQALAAPQWPWACSSARRRVP